jgi:hypothetical protein
MDPDQNKPVDLSGLESDLLQSFQPSWVKESARPSGHAGGSGGEARRREDSGETDWEEVAARWERKPPKDRRMQRKRPPGREEPQAKGPREAKERGRRQPPQRGGPREGGEKRSAEGGDDNALRGWTVRFVPEPRGVEGIAKQIRSTARAYSLFELARLVLEKSPRYLVEFTRTDGPVLHRVVADGTLWTNRSHAAKRLLETSLDTLYERESVKVEEAKGECAIVAVCGMSGELLGPPNHHDYLPRLQRLHAGKFRNVPFETYKSRIAMRRDDETIAKWREVSGTREVFRPREGGETVLSTREELLEHFLANLPDDAIAAMEEPFTVPGPAAVNDSDPSVVAFVRRELDNLINFPLPLAHVIGRGLSDAGLQIFKAHENVTYASVARPRRLDRAATPVSEGISAILDHLENSHGQPRAAQWQALVAASPGGGTDEEREKSVLKDLYWLLHQGHVVDFATRGLEIAPAQPRKPRPDRRPEPKPRQPAAAKTPPPPAEEPAPAEGSDVTEP